MTNNPINSTNHNKDSNQTNHTNPIDFSYHSKSFSTTVSSSLASPSSTSAISLSRRFVNFRGATVWHEFTPLSQRSNAINLGQGFPGFSPPEFVVEAARQVFTVNDSTAAAYLTHQYARSQGHPLLCQQLAQRYSRHFNQAINALTDIVVTAGASEALAGAMLGLVNEGDEVVVLEPTFDMYMAQVEMCGGKTRPVVLTVENGKWSLDMNELEAAFNERTKLFILNTPHNPTGLVFTQQQLQSIVDILLKWPAVIVVSDEVYEYMTYDDHEHISLASFKQVAHRCLTISSAGKTFSTTGWKIGWAVSVNPTLVKSIQVAHQWLLFSVSTPLQIAIATAMQRAEQPYQGFASYYEWLRNDYRKKRELLCDALISAGIEPIVPEGSFFVIGDTSKLQVPASYTADTSVPHDWQLCRWLTQDIGVSAIPPSAFYVKQHAHKAANFARFAFCKSEDELKQAKQRLMKIQTKHSENS